MHAVRAPVVLLVLLMSAWPQAGWSQMAVQPLQPIRDAAIAALGADAASAEATVAADLRLSACAQSLQAVATGPGTAYVRCPDTPGWKLYVPVRVHRDGDVVVLRGPVRAGEPIQPEQLVVQHRNLAAITGSVVSDPAAIIGRTPLHALPAGTPLVAQDLGAGPPLKRGDPVVLLSRVGGVEVRVGGRALGRAMAGGVVTAQNAESQQVVRGRLVAPGVVEVLR